MNQKAKRTILPTRDDEDFKVALRVLERAAKRARESALRTGTPLALWQDGRIKTVMPIKEKKKP